MDKLEEFEKILDKYIIITEKISKKPDIQNKVFILEKEYSYSQILKKIQKTKNTLINLKNNFKTNYFMLSIKFENEVYLSSQPNNENSFFKKEYYSLQNLLSNPGVFTSMTNTPWENVFTENAKNYEKYLENDFPYSHIQNTSGQIYKKFQSLLYILIWVDNEISIFSKDKNFTNTLKKILSDNQSIEEKFDLIEQDKIDNFISFLEKSEHINEDLNLFEEQQIKIKDLLNELNSQPGKNKNTQEELKKMQEETKALLESNKQLSSKFTSKEMSGTFEESAKYYNKSKNIKLLGICGSGIILIISAAISIFHGLSIEELLKLSEKPLALLVHIIPKGLFFIILSSIMLFFIKEYRKESETSLDFTHRKAIADVTPGFRKQVSTEENQEQVVLDAFNLLLNTPNDKKKVDDNQYSNLINFFMSLSIEKRNEIINIFRNILNQSKNSDK